ncbi:MAG: response regulator transcription factor [Sideroxydans sp.]|nr:response regulator transcription factor [Sideroxydans sp.]
MSKFLIVEDHEECRLWVEGLVREIFPEMDIVHADSVAAARAALTGYPVSMALVDIGLPDGSGVELVRHIRESAPHIGVTVMTLLEDDVHLFDALRAGAQGYLLKSQPQTQLLAQLSAMKEGVPPMAPSIARRVLAQLSAKPLEATKPAAANPPMPRLTEREQDVLNRIVRGETVKELSAHLGIAPSTAAGHVRSIYAKLEVNNRAEVVARVMRAGN